MQLSYIGSVMPATTDQSSSLSIPLFSESVCAGFPSPAQDYVEKHLDLNEMCIAHPLASFFVRVQGDSMVEAGIFSGDVLVVDKSLQARHGDVVIASLYGELTVKVLELTPVMRLCPKNTLYSAIPITEESELEIFGVVTCVVRQLERGLYK